MNVFGVVYAAAGSDPAVLVEIAREFAPRIEVCGANGAQHGADRGECREVLLDLRGLRRLFGDARTIAEEMRRTAADRGLRVRVAVAGTRTAARLLVRYRAGLTVIDPGTEAAAVAPLPIGLLAAVASTDPTSVFRQWGLRTLGDVAALPAEEVAARLGQRGVAWQRLARGSDLAPLVPAAVEERFEQALDLEWPIDGLEPLSFVLGRLFEPLAAHLERRDRGAAVLHVRLHLVTRADGERQVHARSLELPAPIRDARTLRTLALLDLESHPPPAAIDRVVVAVDPTPGRVVQFSLLARPLPPPEQVSTLMARLDALMGAGRCGSPAMVDTWQPGAFAMKPFAPNDDGSKNEDPPHTADGATGAGRVLPCGAAGAFRSAISLALRRFRFPVPARVRIEDGRPVRVMTDRRGLSGGRVETCAGPWRTSGDWWKPGDTIWDRDEWDVSLADGGTYRVFRERDTGAWFLDGVVD